jgi:hypothetical protein
MKRLGVLFNGVKTGNVYDLNDGAEMARKGLLCW